MIEPAHGYPRGTSGHEKFLPSNFLNRQLFLGDVPEFDKALFSMLIASSSFVKYSSYGEYESSDVRRPEELSASPVELGFLHFLLRVQGARRVLEIGTFVGISAIALADGLPEDGSVVTIEKFPHFAEIARRNIEAKGLQDKISVLTGDAKEILPHVLASQRFDFVFLDGDKDHYDVYLEHLLAGMPVGGVIAMDDALFFGDVLNLEPRTEKGRGVRRAIGRAQALDQNWEVLVLPIYNGLLLLRRTS